MSTGAEMIAAERRRQIEEEGYSFDHDDLHDEAELSRAAVSYAETAAIQVQESVGPLPPCYIHKGWPWNREWWKPSDDPVLNLVKAGALAAAEIDRINRERENEG